MRLSDIKRDVAAIEQGQWVGAKYDTPIPGMGDLCIKTRGAGNADWRLLETKLINAIPTQLRVGGLSPKDRDRITGRCLLDAGVTDWDCIDGENDGDPPVTYSREQATLFFTNPAYAEIMSAALWAANVVGTIVTAGNKADAKN